MISSIFERIAFPRLTEKWDSADPNAHVSSQAGKNTDKRLKFNTRHGRRGDTHAKRSTKQSSTSVITGAPVNVQAPLISISYPHKPLPEVSASLLGRTCSWPFNSPLFPKVQLGRQVCPCTRKAKWVAMRTGVSSPMLLGVDAGVHFTGGISRASPPVDPVLVRLTTLLYSTGWFWLWVAVRTWGCEATPTQIVDTCKLSNEGGQPLECLDDVAVWMVARAFDRAIVSIHHPDPISRAAPPGSLAASNKTRYRGPRPQVCLPWLVA